MNSYDALCSGVGRDCMYLDTSTRAGDARRLIGGITEERRRVSRSGGTNDFDADPQRWFREGGRFMDFGGNGKGWEGLGVALGEYTMCVNASIMEKPGRLINAPWIVDIDLPIVNDGSRGRSPGYIRTWVVTARSM